MLDPMSGAGGIPLEAFLAGRHAYGNDLQELGYILTTAKTSRGCDKDAWAAFDRLLAHVEDRKEDQDSETVLASSNDASDTPDIPK